MLKMNNLLKSTLAVIAIVGLTACDNIDNDAALAALRDEVYAFIILRTDVFALPGRHGTFLGRRDERREELVDMAVDPAECIAEYITCNAFERREINLHLVHGYILS